MIYSPDIPKKCALCLNAHIIEESGEKKILCRSKSKVFDFDREGCRKFDYDIFKREVKRRKPYVSEIPPESFSLEEDEE